MVNIIAEFCQNHNGDPSLLQEMVHTAKESGATYGKIQTIFSDDLSFRPEFEDGFTIEGTNKVIKRPYQAEYDRLKKLELTYEQQAAFVASCHKYGLIPLTTCFTRGSIPRIAELGMDTVKVASYDCGSLPLIRDLEANFKHLIISTGANYDEEIERTALYLQNKEADFVFLHCVTIYPTPLNQIHLDRMNFLRRWTPRVGLSEHTLVSRDGIKAALAAIFRGADYIERHFTILPPDETKDGPVSITPAHLKELVNFSKLAKEEQEAYLKEQIPEYESMLGDEKRALSPEELLNRAYYRGRFVTHRGGRAIYNWEEIEL